MSKYRFRFSKNVDVPAESEEAARQALGDACDEQSSIVLQDECARGAFEFLGEADIVDIDAESESIGKELVSSRGRILLMSCQYRGENFVALCSQEDVDGTKLKVTPLALVLPNEKLDNLTDLMGNSPIIPKEQDDE